MIRVFAITIYIVRLLVSTVRRTLLSITTFVSPPGEYSLIPFYLSTSLSTVRSRKNSLLRYFMSTILRLEENLSRSAPPPCVIVFALYSRYRLPLEVPLSALSLLCVLTVLASQTNVPY